MALSSKNLTKTHKDIDNRVENEGDSPFRATNLSRDSQRLLNIRAVHTALDWMPPAFTLKDNASSAVTGCEKLQRLTGRSGV